MRFSAAVKLQPDIIDFMVMVASCRACFCRG
jgi:hypothetical protein